MLRMAARRVVFVYGTLKRGEPNHYWLTKKENGEAKFLGRGTTAVKFPLVVGTRYNIPFLLARPGEGNHIEGEVYEVDQAMFAKLDELEEYPDYYDREEQAILTEQNETIQCWLYLIRNFPDKMLAKKMLTSYHNTTEQPYCETYLESCPEDLAMDE
ncbi:putative gamma-glutamylcyclotransferase CG2811 [Drosophila takahashii]|uniref:putative gamma-glutamylcyclotransferase CG2811 n=1 Tax=Drosophila takahashii TaxID=29030 RepID=UPI0038996986